MKVSVNSLPPLPDVIGLLMVVVPFWYHQLSLPQIVVLDHLRIPAHLGQRNSLFVNSATDNSPSPTICSFTNELILMNVPTPVICAAKHFEGKII